MADRSFGSPIPFLEVLSSSVRARERGVLAQMLRSFAAITNAYGCIVWQEVPRQNAGQSSNLYVLADWFQNDSESGIHMIPLDDSLTGTAIRETRPLYSNDVANDDRVHKTDGGFLDRAGVRSFCAVPLSYKDSNGRRGTLNIYRITDEPFRDEDLPLLTQIAATVPPLFDAIRNDSGLHLIGRVNELLHDAEKESPTDPLPDNKLVRLLERLCGLLQDVFACVEVTMRLSRDGLTLNDGLTVTTWPVGLLLSDEDPLPRLLNERVFESGKPVFVFDLDTPDRKELELPDGLVVRTVDEIPGLKDAIRQELPEERYPILPPISYMAVPVRRGEQCYGVIQCRLARQGPYFFTTRDVEHLALGAAQISRFWGNWLAQKGMQDELASWRTHSPHLRVVIRKAADADEEPGRLFRTAGQQRRTDEQLRARCSRKR